MGTGAVGLSARNRELLALIPVALLLTIGFAAVFAQNDTELGNLSLSYGLYFLALVMQHCPEQYLVMLKEHKTK